MVRPTSNPHVRFEAKVQRTEHCWLWKGAHDKAGYGLFYSGARLLTGGQRNVYAHRWSWEQVNGPVPEGLVLDHICENPPCVRVEHLRLATQQENICRGVGASAVNARKKSCPQGHPYSPDNTFIRSGARVCKKCSRARDARKRLAQRRAKAALQ